MGFACKRFSGNLSNVEQFNYKLYQSGVSTTRLFHSKIVHVVSDFTACVDKFRVWLVADIYKADPEVFAIRPACKGLIAIFEPVCANYVWILKCLLHKVFIEHFLLFKTPGKTYTVVKHTTV